MTALDNARAALRGYQRWADDIHAGTTTNEDIMARSLRDLVAEVERLTTPPTDDEVNALADYLLRINDEFAMDTLGARLSALDVAASMLRRLAGFRRRGPVTEAQGRAAFLAFMDMDDADFAEMSAGYRAGSIAQGVSAVEAARAVS